MRGWHETKRTSSPTVRTAREKVPMNEPEKWDSSAFTSELRPAVESPSRALISLEHSACRPGALEIPAPCAIVSRFVSFYP